VTAGWVSAGRRCHSSKRVLQCKLNLAIRQPGVVYLSHGRRVEVIHRDVEVRMIEQVEKLRSELNVVPLGYGKVLKQREIKVANAGSLQAVARD
jgi:hypothetical protein